MSDVDVFVEGGYYEASVTRSGTESGRTVVEFDAASGGRFRMQNFGDSVKLFEWRQGAEEDFADWRYESEVLRVEVIDVDEDEEPSCDAADDCDNEVVYEYEHEQGAVSYTRYYCETHGYGFCEESDRIDADDGEPQLVADGGEPDGEDCEVLVEDGILIADGSGVRVDGVVDAMRYDGRKKCEYGCDDRAEFEIVAEKNGGEFPVLGCRSCLNKNAIYPVDNELVEPEWKDDLLPDASLHQLSLEGPTVIVSDAGNNYRIDVEHVEDAANRILGEEGGESA